MSVLLFDRVDRGRPGFSIHIVSERYIGKGGRFAGLPRSTPYRSRVEYERAANDLARQGLTVRDIAEALKLGTAAAAQLVASRDGNRR